MDTHLRALLIEVAEGRMDPEAAARLLDEPAVGATEPAPAGPAGQALSEPSTPNPTAGPVVPVARVVIQASARPIRVVADRSVDTVSVEGPHSVRREGDALLIDAGPAAAGPNAGGYAFERKGGFSRWLGQASSLGVPVRVRINPELALHVELAAGALDVAGLHGALSFSVAAGTIKVQDCSGPLTGVIRAGSAKFEVRPVAGAHSVRVESGSVDLRLLPGSDVRVRARVELGEVKVKSADGRTESLGGEPAGETVVGLGTATFDLDVVMGSAKVRTP